MKRRKSATLTKTKGEKMNTDNTPDAAGNAGNKAQHARSDTPSRYKVEKYRQKDGFGVARGPVLYGVADQEDDCLLASELLEGDAILICEALNKQAQLKRELNHARAETFAARLRTNEAMRDRDNAIKERDDARECLREAIAEADAGDNAWLMQNTIARWRQAAGIDTGKPRG